MISNKLIIKKCYHNLNFYGFIQIYKNKVFQYKAFTV